MPDPSVLYLCVVGHYWNLLLMPGEPWAKFLTSLMPNIGICKWDHHYSWLLLCPTHWILQLQISDWLSWPIPLHIDMRSLLELTSKDSALRGRREPQPVFYSVLSYPSLGVHHPSISSVRWSTHWLSSHSSGGCSHCRSRLAASHADAHKRTASQFPLAPYSVRHRRKRQTATHWPVVPLP